MKRLNYFRHDRDTPSATVRRDKREIKKKEKKRVKKHEMLALSILILIHRYDYRTSIPSRIDCFASDLSTFER